MKEMIENILKNYRIATNQNFADNPMGKFVRRDSKNIILNSLNLDQNIFEVAGSVGKGQWAEIPWISIFLKDITTTATKGYYIVYLFKADMSGVYLSLNQGWTYFQEKYGSKIGKAKIKTTAKIIRNQLHMVPDGLKEIDIDLNCSKSLGKGYENGHIFGKYYNLEKLPTSNEFINDLKDLILVYKEINNIINNRSIEQFNDNLLLKDDNFFVDVDESKQDYTNAAENIIAERKILSKKKKNIINNEIISDSPKKSKEALIYKNKKTWPRDAQIASNALENANFKCELNRDHQSFISNKTNELYMEPHHLIPLSAQEKFDYSLDVEANIVSLCSNCHNCIHYGLNEVKKDLLKVLYDQRKNRLNKCRIYIEFNDLLNLYKTL